MDIETSIYPYYPELAGLPFRLTGIGGSGYQAHIARPEGYRWYQILHCVSGRGGLLHDGEREEIGENTFIFLPKDSPHEYAPLTEHWRVNWVAFDGSACDSTLRELGLDKAR